MAAKRLHDEYGHDGDQPDDKRMRRLPSFSTYAPELSPAPLFCCYEGPFGSSLTDTSSLNSRVIREAMMQKHMQHLFRCIEPLLRRVVSDSSSDSPSAISSVIEVAALVF
jgi:hypothetical protein